MKQLFISYRHENPEHAKAVRRLGETLRHAGLPVMLDQFYLEENPGGPNDTWPKWCEDQANHSECVLIIASAGWFAAYDKTAQPGIGLGAASEADLFRQDIYEQQGHNARIRLTLLHDLAHDSIPMRLRGWQQFRLFANQAELERLICWTAGRLGITAATIPTVQWPEAIPFTPDLADRQHEWPIIHKLLHGQLAERIVLIEGHSSGLGKSTLLHEVKKYAKSLQIPVVALDFKGATVDFATILGEFDLELGYLLPNFSRDNRVHLLRKDLRALRHPVLVLLDTYEAIADNLALTDWLSQQLFNEVDSAPALCVIIAGQKIPNYQHSSWRSLVKPLLLQPITEVEHWHPWVVQRYPGFSMKGADLATVLMCAQGNPSLVNNFCAAIAGR